MHICLFLHCQCLLDLGNDAVGVDAVGVEHQRGLAAAAKLVVDAVTDDGHGIILAQIFGDCRAKTADCRSSSGETENGEQGASTICRMEKGAGSW